MRVGGGQSGKGQNVGACKEGERAGGSDGWGDQPMRHLSNPVKRGTGGRFSCPCRGVTGFRKNQQSKHTRLIMKSLYLGYSTKDFGLKFCGAGCQTGGEI